MERAKKMIRAVLFPKAAVNTGYAVLKFAAGIFYGSAWLITLAAYYTLLLTMRFLLLLHINRNTRDMAAEWRRCRACDVVLSW